MNRNARNFTILDLALKESGIKNLRARRRLSFMDTMDIDHSSANFTAEPAALPIQDILQEDIESQNLVYTELQSYCTTSSTIDEHPRYREFTAANSESKLNELVPSNPPTLLCPIETHKEKAQTNYVPSNIDLDKSNKDLAEPSTSGLIDTKQKHLSSDCRKRKAKLNKHYLDYMSEEEILFASAFGDCESDTDVWHEVSESDIEEDDDSLSTRKAKKRQNTLRTSDRQDEYIVGEAGVKVKKINIRNKRKALKNAGLEYIKSNGDKVATKCVQPNPCLGKKCGNNCGVIDEDRRRQIFEHFWKLSADRRKDWIISLCQKVDIKRKRSNSNSSNRNVTYKYFINDGEGKRLICLQFLASTLNVSHKFIYYTVSNAVYGFAKEDLRGKCEPPNKTKVHTKNMVCNFIKNLPAVPSHYCRKDSSRVYLPQEFKNLSNLYKIYKAQYIEQGIDIVSDRVFRIIFKDFNIGFHIPKKDKCIKCLKFEHLDQNNANIKAEILAHEAEKESSYARFKAHQTVHKTDPSTLCVSFDLEKVLNTPHGNSMLLYYSRKLAVYNLCFYESITRQVFCYYWDEVNGKRGANEISTILNKYINRIDEQGKTKNLLLYCDCCPGQNRNRVVLAMIHSTLQTCKTIEAIQINFLLTGHTYMPVDSVHAVIEKNIKNCIIYAPSQWYTVFTTARQDPVPYNVEIMTYKDFLKWDIVSEKYFKGNLTGKISKIRVATFKKKDESKITVKFSMDEAEENTSIEVQSKIKIAPTACYKSLLPVSKAKFDNLSKLCKDKVIPSPFHREYLDIPYNNTIKDVLPDTDIEDIDAE